MARGPLFQRILQLVLDRASVEKTKKDTQKAIQDATDPKAGQRNLSLLDRALDKTRGVVTRMSDAFRTVSRSVAVAAAAVAGYVVALTKLTERGGEVIGVQRAFARAVGDTDAAINKLRKATGGLVTDYELMVGFNRAFSLGAVDTIDQFAEMSRVALDLSRAMGIDAAFAMERLTLAIGRGSKLILDDLGLQVEGAVTVASAMEAARKAIAEFGGATTTGADSVRRFLTQIKNLKDEVAIFLANSRALRIAFEEAANVAETLVMALQSGNRQTIIEAFKTTGAAAGSAFAGAMAEALSVGLRQISNAITPNFLQDRGFVWIFDIFSGAANLTKEAADAAFEAASAHVDALGALGRQLEAEAKLRAKDAPAGTAAGRRGEPGMSAEEQLKLQDDLRSKIDQRVAALIRAHELGVATADETRELRLIHENVVFALQQENLAIEERIRLTERLASIESTVPSFQRPDMFRRADDQIGRVLQGGVTPIFEFPKDSMGNPIIRASADIKSAAEEIGVTWHNVFQAVGEEAQALSFVLASALSGDQGVGEMLAQIAPLKMRENIARALEAGAAGLARFVLYGDAPAIAAGAKAAAGHTAAAAAWGLLGAAGGGGGDSRGGFGAAFGGNLPTSRDQPGRSADRFAAPQQTIIHVHMDPLDPRNGRYQSNVGEAVTFFNERQGNRIR